MSYIGRLNTRSSLLILIAGLLTSGGVVSAQAQTYPDREIRLVLGFPPGGGADLMTRYFAEKLAPLSGKPVIVENKPGAAGHLAHTYVAQSRPDGYTVYVVGGTTLGSSLHVLKNPPIDPLRDLEPNRHHSQIALGLGCRCQVAE